MTAERRAVSDVGEQGLLELLSSRLKPPPQGSVWSGDDAAIVDIFPGRAVLTTDVIVESIDFRLDTFGPDDIGWKAMAINVSDIAAMAATPLYALATISLRRDVPVELFEGVADGLFLAAEEFGVYLVGGDISEASELSVGVTLIGLPGERTVTRDGARPGDAICVTGELGGAAGGLFALEHEVDAPGAIERQRRPRPRVLEARSAAHAGATAMIDLSDGLAMDLGHILRASAVGCDVDLDALPVHGELSSMDIDAIETAVTGGEDFELLFTIPEAAVVDALDVTTIGVVTDGPARLGGRPLEEWRKGSWDHLRDR
jgi:thiamine-monophosphate kinase